MMNILANHGGSMAALEGGNTSCNQDERQGQGLPTISWRREGRPIHVFFLKRRELRDF